MKRLTLILTFAALLISAAAGFSAAGELWFRTWYIVRHAEKADDGTKDPPLSPEGETRARELAVMLKDAAIGGFFTSPYKRTRMTAQAVANVYAPNHPITEVDAKDYDELVKQCQQVHGNVLIAGHSNTVPELIKKLTGREFTIDHDEYDNLFIVTQHVPSNQWTVTRLHFGKRYEK